MRWRGLGWSFFVFGVLSTASVAAQPVDDATRAAARALGNGGVAAYQAKDYRTANDKLGRAYQVLQVPSLGLWSARALVKVGSLVEASQRYLDVTRLEVSTGDTQVQKQAVVDAQKELAALTPRLPGVIVKVNGAEASQVALTIDGTALSSALAGENRPINPGTHRIAGQRGTERQEASVTVAEGEQKTATLTFTAVPPEAPAVKGPKPLTPATESAPPAETQSHSGMSRTLGWAAVGVGGAGIVVGAITGAMVLGKKSSIDDSPNCSGSRCLPSESDRVDSYNSLRTVSTIGFVAGGVLAATGVVLLLTAPKSNETESARELPRSFTSWALRAGPGSVAVSGSF